MLLHLGSRYKLKNESKYKFLDKKEIIKRVVWNIGEKQGERERGGVNKEEKQTGLYLIVVLVVMVKKRESWESECQCIMCMRLVNEENRLSI